MKTNLLIVYIIDSILLLIFERHNLSLFRFIDIGYQLKSNKRQKHGLLLYLLRRRLEFCQTGLTKYSMTTPAEVLQGKSSTPMTHESIRRERKVLFLNNERTKKKRRKTKRELLFLKSTLENRRTFSLLINMGCGGSQVYTENDVKKYLNDNILRYPSAELVDGTIRLKSLDGFFNSNSLLDSSWLQGKLTNQEYRQAIEHVNQRVSQATIGTPKHVSIDQVQKAQTTLLAVEELNGKYSERARFKYEYTQQENTIQPAESYLIISFK